MPSCLHAPCHPKGVEGMGNTRNRLSFIPSSGSVREDAGWRGVWCEPSVNQIRMDIVGLLAVCSFLHQGLSLSCYECNSRDNATCREHPPDSAKKECTQGKPVCRVQYLEVNTVIEGRTPHSRVIRSCGQMEETEEVKRCYRISDYGAHQIVCSCTEDNCNSSTKSAATIPTVATALLFTLYC